MQSSFSALELAAKKKLTRRERFLREIDAVTPWAELMARIEPFYPKGGGRGRPPIGLERMLRMYVVQLCLGLSDEGLEDAVYDSQAIRGFIGIDLAREAAPDATALLKFRRLLETHNLTQAIFEAIKAHLSAKGLLLREGSIVDATIIRAPSSTKNDSGSRDPRDAPDQEGQHLVLRHEGAYRRRPRFRTGAHRRRYRGQRQRRHRRQYAAAWTGKARLR